MLRSLHVRNLAIIESADVEFGPGLNAITGETGAGKSVLIGALELVLGARASTDAIRSGAAAAVVEAVFEFASGSALDPGDPEPISKFLADELGVDWLPADSLTLRREISSKGRNRCFVADQMVAVADLRRLSERLIDLHGQHEHQSLFRLGAQRAALDAVGETAKLIAKYRKRYDLYRNLARRKEELERKASNFEKQLDYLDFQIAELEELGLEAGELESLQTEETRLANAESLREEASHAYHLLYESEREDVSAIVPGLAEVLRLLESLSGVDAKISELLERATEAQAQLEDIAHELRGYTDGLESDPRRLDQVVGRIESIKRLLRKHGCESEQVLVDLSAALKTERESLHGEEAELGSIEQAVAEARAELDAAAKKLTEARTRSAGKLARGVLRTLKQVGMERAQFEVIVSPLDEPQAEGADRVEFLLAANPGEGIRPLREVASGGEISRTMLAIKTILAARDAVPVLVFDEVDAGISGRTAVQVGELMAQLAGSHQIICITHQAAIAARGGTHLSVAKGSRGGRTFMSVRALDREGRLEELARLLGGEGESAAGKKLAEQLLGSR